MSNTRLKLITICSPIFIIPILFIIAFVLGNVIGVWVWVPIVLVYWSLIMLLLWLNGGKNLIDQWLAPAKGAWYWKGLALVPVVLLLFTFLGNLHFFAKWWIVALTIVLVLINPFLEEAYWRGLLMDQTDTWPSWTSLLYTNVLFAVNHLTLGVHSIASRHPIAILAISVMGLIWGIVYKKTKSLRWVILGHILVDIFNLTRTYAKPGFIPPIFANPFKIRED